MPPKIRYKVVRVFRDRKKILGIYSCCVVHELNINNEDIVEYKIGEWVKPKIENSRLFVFRTLADAKRFKNSCSLYGVREIFECEVKNPRKMTKICTCPNHDWQFWVNKSLLSKDMIGKAPLGSIGCTEVKLIQKV